MNILQPLTSFVEIAHRQDSIQVLMEREERLMELQMAIDNLPDIDNFISSLIRRENQLSARRGEDLVHRVLLLKKMLQKTGQLASVLVHVNDTPYLSDIFRVHECALWRVC